MNNPKQDRPHQKGAPQDTSDMPSAGNSPAPTGASRGTDESPGASQDVERSGMTGSVAQTAMDSRENNEPSEESVEGREN